jgi:hypothetical protein
MDIMVMPKLSLAPVHLHVKASKRAGEVGDVGVVVEEPCKAASTTTLAPCLSALVKWPSMTSNVETPIG